MKSIKKMLCEQELVVGLTIIHSYYPWVAKLYADAGADFVYLETEHVAINGAELGNFVLSCRLCGVPVVAKCDYVDRSSIAKLLDVGVMGIQLPMSETGEQLSDVVKYTKFPPVGVRAAAPGLGNTSYRSDIDIKGWLEESNEETVVLAHIESRTGLENVDEILGVAGVDIMFVGMFDLTVSLGRAGQYDHPEVVKAIERLIGAAKEHGKVAGMWTPSFEVGKPWVKKGIRFFESGADIDFIGSGAKTAMNSFPGHGAKKS